MCAQRLCNENQLIAVNVCCFFFFFDLESVLEELVICTVQFKDPLSAQGG